MKPSDLMEIEQIEKRSFSSKWQKEHFLYELSENDYAYLYVVEVNGRVVAYIDFWITFDICQLASIAVHPAFRRAGHAHALMQQMISDAINANCDNISLEVRISNLPAQKLYESFGFMQVNVRKGYYSDNQEDALLLVKPLGMMINE